MHRDAEGMRGGMSRGMDRGGAGMHSGMGRGMHANPQGMGRGRPGGAGAEGSDMGHGMREGMRGPATSGSAEREVPEELQEGQRIFGEICSVCHTMDPPPNLAPPMSHVARHLRASFTTEDEAVAHVVGYLPEPARERSILSDMPHERFGLMPPQPLPRPLLEAVARYIWFLGGEG
jgi:cytochrome c